MKNIFSERLTAIRHAAGLHQRQAAAQLGVSQALLSHYENGAREPKLEFVARACKFYDVSSDYLLGLSQQQSYSGMVALPYKTDCGRELAESFCEIAEQLHDTGDAEMTVSAVKYLSLSAATVTHLLGDPNSLYEPRRDADIKLAEAELLEHIRRVSATADDRGV